MAQEEKEVKAAPKEEAPSFFLGQVLHLLLSIVPHLLDTPSFLPGCS